MTRPTAYYDPSRGEYILTPAGARAYSAHLMAPPRLPGYEHAERRATAHLDDALRTTRREMTRALHTLRAHLGLTTERTPQ